MKDLDGEREVMTEYLIYASATEDDPAESRQEGSSITPYIASFTQTGKRSIKNSKQQLIW